MNENEIVKKINDLVRELNETQEEAAKLGITVTYATHDVDYVADPVSRQLLTVKMFKEYKS